MLGCISEIRLGFGRDLTAREIGSIPVRQIRSAARSFRRSFRCSRAILDVALPDVYPYRFET